LEATAFHAGNRLFFVESLKTFPADLKRAQPTIFFSIPRILMKFQQGVLEKVPAPKLDRLLRIPVIRRFVGRRILREMGLGSVRVAASGGAPLPVPTLEWFRKVGLKLVEGYGMTETGITHTPEGAESRPGYVGNSAPGVETKIAENGEVLLRSPMNLVGYYKDPDATRNAFTEDGFFRTGDLGELDKDGWLKIIGRVKEQFKTSKGKYVSPAGIELALCADPLIESCCVMGAGAPAPFAVVTLSLPASTHKERARRAEELTALLRTVNAGLETHERLAFLVATDQHWTIANGMLTPTMKMRRGVLESRYAAFIEEWQRREEEVIWHTGAGSKA
jgi:long-chain acyl-CoA synthetase